MKKIMKELLLGLNLGLLLCGRAYARELVAGGEAAGIQISTDGVVVEGVGNVDTKEGVCCPAEEAGLKKGDIITEINGEKLEGAGELIDKVS